MKMYESKNLDYFSNARKDVIDFISDGNNKILEVGCSNGATLYALKQNGKAEEVIGVDIMDKNQFELDKFIVGNVEEMDLPFEKNYFDIIVLADVLEHLVDPWSSIKGLTEFLKDDGQVIVSLPNIREIKSLLKIVVLGDFRYEEAGILDQTHLRFFCKKNMLDLFKSADLKVEDSIIKIANNRKLFNLLTFKIFEGLLVAQYVFSLRKDRFKS